MFKRTCLKLILDNFKYQILTLQNQKVGDKKKKYFPIV